MKRRRGGRPCPAHRAPVVAAISLAAATTAIVASHSRDAAADTLAVGPGKTYPTTCAAIAVAQAGDVIEADAAGDYTDDTCTWSTDDLTVRGVNGRAAIALKTVIPSGSKGIFTIEPPAVSVTIENFELSGAAIPSDGKPGDANGAGIRHQATNLTVRNCFLHDNQDGILAAPATGGTGSVLIEGTEFARNGFGDGFTHNAYINEYASATIIASYSHDANVGHLYKSRADVNYVLYNRLTDENGTASYELDLPQGGLSYVIGNLIEQSATTMNPNLIGYAEENEDDPDHHLYLVNNTLVNDHGGASDAFVWLEGASSVALFANNVLAGGGVVSTGVAPTVAHDWNGAIADAKLVDAAGFDYRLGAGSPAIDMGADPGSAGAQSLAPVAEYAGVDALVERVISGAAIDIGAYEYGAALDGGVAPLDDGGTASSGGGGRDRGSDGGVTSGVTSGGAAADGGGAAGLGSGSGSGPGSGSNDGGCSCALGPARPESGARDALSALGLLGLVLSATTRRRARRR